MDEQKFRQLEAFLRTVYSDLSGQRGWSLLSQFEKEEAVNVGDLIDEFSDWLDYDYEGD